MLSPATSVGDTEQFCELVCKCSDDRESSVNWFAIGAPIAGEFSAQTYNSAWVQWLPKGLLKVCYP